MPDYTEFFLSHEEGVFEIDLLEIDHQDFAFHEREDGTMGRGYRITRNDADGVTVTLPDGSDAFFGYFPYTLEVGGARSDLDFGIQIGFHDLGELLPAQIDVLRAATRDDRGLDAPMTVKYYIYSSIDLTQPLFAAEDMEVYSIRMNGTASQFSAIAPRVNLSSTGERYDLGRYAPLQGLLDAN